MEQELRCPVCNNFYEDPVILPCLHSACFSCVERSSQLVLPSALHAKTDRAFRTLNSREMNDFEEQSSVIRPMPTSASMTALPNFERGHDWAQWKRRLSNCTDAGIETRANRKMSMTQLEPTSMRQLQYAAHGLTSSSLDDGSATNLTHLEGEIGIEFFADRDVCSFDRMSITSETDSGVICGVSNHSANSTGCGPTSNLFGHEIQGIHRFFCPTCNLFICLNNRGAAGLRKNVAIHTLVEKYVTQKSPHTECQLCEGNSKSLAVRTCEQCEVSYCQMCLERCHPLRGPLAKHTLLNPAEGMVSLKTKHKKAVLKCVEHTEESFSSFCVTCQDLVCCLCLHSGTHSNHLLQTLALTSKTHKMELSQMLHKLSERARAVSDFIKELKAVQPSIRANCMEFEALIVAKCDKLIEAIQKQKLQLLEKLNQEQLHRQEVCENQIMHSSAKLQKATGLLQLNIELLKETDPAAFLQISHGLMNRVMAVDRDFCQDFPMESKVLPAFDLHLEIEPILNMVQNLNFYQQKVPSRPSIIVEECSSEQNTVMISWQPPEPTSEVDGYILELAEASDSLFREVFRGTETMCLVEGLHFNTQYLARVRAFNRSGHSQFSDCISLKTARVTWFTLDRNSCPPDVMLSNGNVSALCNSTDNCVILGSVGLSRGVHYWEFFIDQFENNCDPAFGIARIDVEKNMMLGKSELAWSMYVDGNRSWFMHAGEHHTRTEGGIRVGSKVGILLNLDAGTVSFYINEKLRGFGAAFRNLRDVFYPAVSINRHVKISLNSGINPPSHIFDD